MQLFCLSDFASAQHILRNIRGDLEHPAFFLTHICKFWLILKIADKRFLQHIFRIVQIVHMRKSKTQYAVSVTVEKFRGNASRRFLLRIPIFDSKFHIITDDKK